MNGDAMNNLRDMLAARQGIFKEKADILTQLKEMVREYYGDSIFEVHLQKHTLLVIAGSAALAGEMQLSRHRILKKAQKLEPEINKIRIISRPLV